MSKYLIMCEGPNEKRIIELLLENNKLLFTKNDLVGLVPYHARTLTSPVIKLALNMYHGDFVVLRVGDVQNDVLKIPKEYKKRIVSIEKYCTKPELEVLLLLCEGMYAKYLGCHMNPKSIAKDCISYNHRRYDNSTLFWNEYFVNRIENLVWCLHEYKRIKKHNKDELYIADLLK